MDSETGDEIRKIYVDSESFSSLDDARYRFVSTNVDHFDEEQDQALFNTETARQDSPQDHVFSDRVPHRPVEPRTGSGRKTGSGYRAQFVQKSRNNSAGSMSSNRSWRNDKGVKPLHSNGVPVDKDLEREAIYQAKVREQLSRGDEFASQIHIPKLDLRGSDDSDATTQKPKVEPLDINLRDSLDDTPTKFASSSDHQLDYENSDSEDETYLSNDSLNNNNAPHASGGKDEFDGPDPRDSLDYPSKGFENKQETSHKRPPYNHRKHHNYDEEEQFTLRSSQERDPRLQNVFPLEEMAGVNRTGDLPPGPKANHGLGRENEESHAGLPNHEEQSTGTEEEEEERKAAIFQQQQERMKQHVQSLSGLPEKPAKQSTVRKQLSQNNASQATVMSSKPKHEKNFLDLNKNVSNKKSKGYRQLYAGKKESEQDQMKRNHPNKQEDGVIEGGMEGGMDGGPPSNSEYGPQYGQPVQGYSVPNEQYYNPPQYPQNPYGAPQYANPLPGHQHPPQSYQQQYQPYQQAYNPHQQGPYQQGPYQQSPHQQGPHQQGPHQQGPHQQGPHHQQSHQPMKLKSESRDSPDHESAPVGLENVWAKRASALQEHKKARQQKSQKTASNAKQTRKMQKYASESRVDKIKDNKQPNQNQQRHTEPIKSHRSQTRTLHHNETSEQQTHTIYTEDGQQLNVDVNLRMLPTPRSEQVARQPNYSGQPGYAQTNHPSYQQPVQLNPNPQHPHPPLYQPYYEEAQEWEPYSSPRRRFHGPPPPQPGYNGPPPPQPGYNGPPPHQPGYNAPPPGQGYNAPPPHQPGYNAPPPPQPGYNGPPPHQPGYNAPPPGQGYQQGYYGNQGYHQQQHQAQHHEQVEYVIEGRTQSPMSSPYKVLPPIGSADSHRSDRSMSPGRKAKPPPGDSSARGAGGSYMQSFKEKQKPKVEYKAYTLKDYKSLKQEVKLGGLGPNLESEEAREKRELAEKKEAYARSVAERNRKKNLKQRTTSESRENENEVDEKHNKRQMALQYAKKVPKPKVKPQVPASEVENVTSARNTQRKPADYQQVVDIDGVDLEQLQMRHEMERRKAEEIRQNMEGVLSH